MIESACLLDKIIILRQTFHNAFHIELYITEKWLHPTYTYFSLFPWTGEYQILNCISWFHYIIMTLQTNKWSQCHCSVLFVENEMIKIAWYINKRCLVEKWLPGITVGKADISTTYMLHDHGGVTSVVRLLWRPIELKYMKVFSNRKALCTYYSYNNNNDSNIVTICQALVNV